MINSCKSQLVNNYIQQTDLASEHFEEHCLTINDDPNREWEYAVSLNKFAELTGLPLDCVKKGVRRTVNQRLDNYLEQVKNPNRPLQGSVQEYVYYHKK